MGARTGRALQFSPDALRALLSHDWPGNVRELENALEFAATVCRGQTLQPEDLPPEVLHGGGSHPADAATGSDPSRNAFAESGPRAGAAELGSLAALLDAHRWDRGAAAQALGVSRSTLWRRMSAAGLARGRPRSPPAGRA